MALQKSAPSHQDQSQHLNNESEAKVLQQEKPSISPSVSPPFARRGVDFGKSSAAPSVDTYVKVRFSDAASMPETWFKLNVYSNGVHAFEPTGRDNAYVLLMNKGDSKLRMYHIDDSSNFDEVGPKRFENVVAELEVRKRRDSTPENPQMFLVGSYVERVGTPAREMRGNMVGAQSKDLMLGLSTAGYAEWKGSQPLREAAAPMKEPLRTLEMVAGQELNFGI